jgi:hypothetical protein
MKKPETFEEFKKELKRCAIEGKGIQFDVDRMIALWDSMTGPQPLSPMKDAPREGGEDCEDAWVFLYHKDRTFDIPIPGYWDGERWADGDTDSWGNLSRFKDDDFDGWRPIPKVRLPLPEVKQPTKEEGE